MGDTGAWRANPGTAPRIVVIGSGSLARSLCYSIATEVRSPADVLILARNNEKAAEIAFVSATRASLSEASVTFHGMGADLGRLDELLAKHQPDVLVQCASHQSPWERSTAPSAWTELIAAAGFGITLPLQAALVLDVAETIRAVAPHCLLINACFPDAVNPILLEWQLPIFCGIGNISTLAASIQSALGRKDQSTLHLLAHHVHLHATAAEARLWCDGVAPADAELLDPQQRLFLETAWLAVEDAGYDVTRYDGTIGVFAGAAVNKYLLRHLLPHATRSPLRPDGQLTPGHTPDYLPARVSYHLGLTGPSVAVQTARSSSLVAVCFAAQALQDFRCDMAIAGGVAITSTTPSGYLSDGVDGRCRAFDARAAGSAPGNGVGAVLLKRLADAVDDGDHVDAILRGWAVTNEGADRAGFLVPGVDGLAAVVAEALTAAELAPETIGLVEASVGGTAVGDAIEVTALRRGFAAAGGEPVRCALGAVKTNIGNLDAASGIAGLIKAVLAVRDGTIPANLHFEVPNRDMDLTASGFSVPEKTMPWPATHAVRRAGVTAIGMGGTNAHVIVEQPPPIVPAARDGGNPALVLSGRTPDAVRISTRRIAAHLAAHPKLSLADVAYTLRVGRCAFGYRTTVTVAALNGESVIEQVPPDEPPDALPPGRRVSLPGYPFRW